MCTRYRCLPSQVNAEDPFELWVVTEVSSAMQERAERDAKDEARKAKSKRKH